MVIREPSPDDKPRPRPVGRAERARRAGLPKRPGSRDLPARQLLRWPEKVVGGKYVHQLERLIAQLRPDDAHGNCRLFLDDVFIAYLLAFFNPALRSLRTLEDFSQTEQAQRHLSVPKICKSTLSDFNKLADPTRLQPILDHLRRAVLKPGRGKPPNSLEDLHRRVLATDGTFLKVAADVAWAFRRSGKKSGARLDFTIDAQTWLPEVVVVADKSQSEAANAVTTITPGAIHLYDRGIFSFDLVRAHLTAPADFVVRLREAGEHCPKFAASQDRELTENARKAGVVSDRLGRLAGSKNHKAPAAVLREVVIVLPDATKSPVRLLTNLLDFDAEIIGLLYRNRWQVELFFRWIKCYAHFDHLISHVREGVLLSFYVAVVGATLMYLHTGQRPNKYLFTMMGLVASGAATLEEVLPILRERERRNQLERDRVARKRAAKTSQ